MRKLILPIVCVIALGGCSDENAASTKARQEFNQALASFEAAQQGLVSKKSPKMEENPESLGIEATRQEQLHEALKKLEALKNKGSDTQQAGVQVLIADAYADDAQHTAQQAMSRWSEQSANSTMVIGKLISVDHAATRAQLFSVDLGPMLAQLHKDQADNDARVGDLEKQAKDLQGKADTIRQAVDAARAKSDADRAQVLALQSKAFGQKGPAQDALYAQASALRATATESSGSAQKQAADLDVVLGELAVAAKQVELCHSASHSIADQIANLEQRQKNNQDEQKKALDEKAAKATELTDALKTLVDDFNTTVDAPLADAEKQAQKSIDALGAAVAKAHGTDKKALQQAMLAKQVIQAGIMAQHVIAASGMRRTLDVLAAQSDRLVPGVTAYADDKTHAKDTQDTSAANAKSAIGRAINLAAELASGSDDRITAYTNELNAYAKMVDDAVGNGPAASPAAGSGTGDSN